MLPNVQVLPKLQLANDPVRDEPAMTGQLLPGAGNPSVVTCNPNPPGGGNGNNQSVGATTAGAAVGGIFAGLPAACLWVRRRTRKQAAKRG